MWSFESDVSGFSTDAVRREIETDPPKIDSEGER